MLSLLHAPQHSTAQHSTALAAGLLNMENRSFYVFRSRKSRWKKDRTNETQCRLECNSDINHRIDSHSHCVRSTRYGISMSKRARCMRTNSIWANGIEEVRSIKWICACSGVCIERTNEPTNALFRLCSRCCVCVFCFSFHIFHSIHQPSTFQSIVF